MPVENAQEIPVNVVGSSIFGRYPKISLEKTYNMFISDGWLVNYAGFQRVSEIQDSGEGRGVFHSVRGNFMLVVANSSVYKITDNLVPQFIANIETNSGEVSIDENLSNQICIVDGQKAYIYNYETNQFVVQTLLFISAPIIPNYVTYHNTFFLIASAEISENPQNWYAFDRASDTTIVLNTQFSLQTKPDSAIAVKRLPGKGNNVIVFGTTVAEVWTQVGGLENYRRVQSFNIDSGTVSSSTIAASEEIVAWIAQNESNAPSVRVCDGSSSKRISTDGIDYLLQTIKHPQDATALFFRQDGHLFYQFTFFNPEDNITLVYDVTADKIYHASDESLNFHPARQVVFFNQKTFFVSLNDPSLYEMSTDFISYNYNLDSTIDGDEIPRIRITKAIRMNDSGRFRAAEFTFWIEQGVNNYFEDTIFTQGVLETQDGEDDIITQEGDLILAQDGFASSVPENPRVDMSVSKNGNQSFSNVVGKYLNASAHFRNQIRWQRIGQANELSIQLRFWGLQRFVAQDGIMKVIV